MSKDNNNTVTDFSCGVIPYRIVDGEKQFLLIQHNAGHWAFPKGHPENGETNLEAARRELLEETGIPDVAIDETHPFEEAYCFTKHSGKQVSKRVVYFLGEVASDQAVVLQEEEVADHAWGTEKKTRKRLTFDEGKALFDTVLSYLGD